MHAHPSSQPSPRVPGLFRGWSVGVFAVMLASAAAVIVCYVSGEDIAPSALVLAAASVAHTLNSRALARA